MSDSHPTVPTGGESPRPVPGRPAPNYAARRMLATTIVITAVMAAGLTVWRLAGGDTTRSTAAAAEWDGVAVIDRITGGVTVHDPSGRVTAEIAGTGRVRAVYADRDRLALVGADQIAIVDTAEPGAEPVIVPIAAGSVVTPAPTSAHLHLLVGAPAGGDVLIVTLADGGVIDVASAAGQSNPLMFAETARWAADGSMFAIADAVNFQTIVVRPGIGGATFLADQPIAVGDDVVATSQTVGLEADVALVALDRRILATVPSEIPVGGIVHDGRLVFVSADGGVFRFGEGDTTAERLAEIAVPADAQVRWMRPTADGTRLVIAGDRFETVTGTEGGTMFATTFASPVAFAPPDPAWTCLAVGGGDTYQALISLDSGDRLAALDGLEVVDTSHDGCTLLAERAGVTEVVSADGSVSLGVVRAAWLAPDGRSVVATSPDGRTELRAIDSDLQLSDPIVLGGPTSSNLAVAFVGG